MNFIARILYPEFYKRNKAEDIELKDFKVHTSSNGRILVELTPEAIQKRMVKAYEELGKYNL